MLTEDEITMLRATEARAHERLDRVATAYAERKRLCESPAEAFMLELLLCAGCFDVEQQVTVGRFRIDFAFVAERLAVEVDGFAYHGSQAAFEADRRRDRELMAAGWRVVRVAVGELYAEPKRCVEDILALRRVAA